MQEQTVRYFREILQIEDGEANYATAARETHQPQIP
jgi:hypothetical protein